MSADSRVSRPAALIALLSVWGFAGYTLTADGANPGRSGSGSGAELVRQVKYAPELRANLSDTERYVVNGVCEIDGVRQISQILRRSDFEEMWGFCRARTVPTAASGTKSVARKRLESKVPMYVWTWRTSRT